MLNNNEHTDKYTLPKVLERSSFLAVLHRAIGILNYKYDTVTSVPNAQKILQTSVYEVIHSLESVTISENAFSSCMLYTEGHSAEFIGKKLSITPGIVSELLVGVTQLLHLEKLTAMRTKKYPAVKMNADIHPYDSDQLLQETEQGKLALRSLLKDLQSTANLNPKSY